MNPKYPDITVRLVGRDGNAFAILGAVHEALQQAGVPRKEQDDFQREATSGDYDQLLQTVVRWVNVA